MRPFHLGPWRFTRKWLQFALREREPLSASAVFPVIAGELTLGTNEASTHTELA